MRKFLVFVSVVALQGLVGWAEAAVAYCNSANIGEFDFRAHIQCEQPISEGAASI